MSICHSTITAEVRGARKLLQQPRTTAGRCAMVLLAPVLLAPIATFVQAAPSPAGQAAPSAQQRAPAAGQPKGPPAAGEKKPLVRFDIDEYRIEGADQLKQLDVEEAVYPFLGPGRTAEDVEKARAALEKAYQGKGYQTVVVSIPEQNVRRGIIVLKVVEARVGRLSVKNSRYFDLEKIKEKAPSVAEGKLPNFNDVTKDIVSLNQWPDRKVTPALRAGVTPGTVDVDLNVEDKLPLHGTVELNNRRSPNTTALRSSATLHYDNLWQRGDSISATYQVAPQRIDDAQAFSGSYLARTHVDWLNILIYGVKSTSNVTTIGSQNIVGPGQIIGLRAVITLPTRDKFFHTLAVGWDYKHFEQTVASETQNSSTPITYYPIVAQYSATLNSENAVTVLNGGVTFGPRGFGSDPWEFNAKRFNADANFFYFRGDIAHTRELPEKWQIYGRIQGQVADQPLVSSEQFTATGADYVRGYLESEVLGDNGLVGTLELRTPNLGDVIKPEGKDEDGKPLKPIVNEWRFFVFGDGGRTIIMRGHFDQQTAFWLASYGVGVRVKLFDFLYGSVALAIPVIGQSFTFANDPHLLFRVYGEF